MNVTLDAWRRLWGELGAREINGGLFNQLVSAYSERHRRYHTLQHLRECLAHGEAAAMLARAPGEVELALWFHDAVYDPQRQDNEARSAEWARTSVRAAGCAAAIADRVAAMVLATQAHELSTDIHTQLVLDIDLAILGAAPARFAEYEAQVRAEYAHVPDEAFRAGRVHVLGGFLARRRIYGTAAFHDALEARARGNLGQALTRLRGASDPPREAWCSSRACGYSRNSVTRPAPA
jgi:predicted metal-dependent HD superfamily phosphohydrolase